MSAEKMELSKDMGKKPVFSAKSIFAKAKGLVEKPKHSKQELDDENFKIVAHYFSDIQKPDETIVSIKQNGYWELLNDRMRFYLEFLAGLKKNFPIVSVRGSLNDGPLNTSFYVMGITDKYYRTSRSPNINYDSFFNDKKTKDISSIGIGDLIILNESSDERRCHAHQHSEVPNLLISRSAVYVGDINGTKFYFGSQPLKPVTGVFDVARLISLCTLSKQPEHHMQLRVYDKSLFESEQSKKQLKDLLLKKDETYFGG